MRRLINFFSKEVSIVHHAAYILAISSLSSQFLALIRDRLLASSFGASFDLDLYYSAFRLPDMVFATVGSLVSASVLLPTIALKFSQDKKDLKNFIDSIFSIYSVIVISVSFLLVLFSPFILKFIFPNIKGDDFSNLVLLTRILLLSPIFLGISNLMSSIVQIHQRFFISALSPVLYNIGIITGILFLYPYFGLVGLVLGVIMGAIMHFAIQVPFVFKEGFFPSFSLSNINKEVKKIFYLSVPRTVTVSSAEISELFLISFASFLTIGSISIFTLAFNLQSVPFSIIGVSYSVAVFPTLSKLFAKGQMELFFERLSKVASHIIFWSIPATVLIFILRFEIVKILLGSGRFDDFSSKVTAVTFAIFSLSLVFQNLTLLFIRSFYAQGKTRTPLFINIFGALVIILSSYGFSMLFDQSMYFKNTILKIFDLQSDYGIKVITLALGYSFGTLCTCLLYILYISINFKNLPIKMFRTFIEVFSASLFASFVVNFVANLLNIKSFYFIPEALLLTLLSLIIFGVVFVFVLILFKNKELKETLESIFSRFSKKDISAIKQDF